MTGIHLCSFVLLVSILKYSCEAAEVPLQDRGQSRIARSVASEKPHSGYTVEYTLVTANSPDCERSLVDEFPVRLQYRTIISGGDGGQSINNSVSEWMDSPKNMSGTLTRLKIPNNGSLHVRTLHNYSPN